MKHSLFPILFFAIVGSLVFIPLTVSKPIQQRAQLETTGTMQASLR